jgi:hypothetical protein
MEQNKKQPFFAALLESQAKIPAPGEQYFPIPWPGPGTRPGGDYETMKYPSDDDEEGPKI